MAVGLPVISSRASASFQGQEQPPQPTFRTEANYVRVDVYPTRDDAPVADLTQADFEVLDNGTPQKIEQFERVVIRAAGPQEARLEPNTVRESRAILEDSRARVLVIFFDTHHVDLVSSRRIRKPLTDFLSRVIGTDDLVGMMTPYMAATDVTFGRRTGSIENFLTQVWPWGERGQIIPVDPEEQLYWACFPGNQLVPRDCPNKENDRNIASEMVRRRREKRTLDALQDLVRYLRGVREERKAILVVTDGWLLYGRNDQLARPIGCDVPTGPPVVVDPGTGKLTTKDTTPGNVPLNQCERDRMVLSRNDNEEQFRLMLDEANRANASFYPIDPRGLPVFETPLSPVEGAPSIGESAPQLPLDVDAAMLRARVNSLRRLAEGTDGLAVVNSNDLSGGLRRIVADMSAYYLLGYYASGKLDGKFHSITVRVKRPGVRVRARRGYLAASEADLNASAGATARANAAPAPSPAAAAEARAIETAIAPLDGYARQLPIRIRAAAGWKPGNAAAVWLVGELGAGPEWKGGADADLLLTNATGATLASAQARVEPGARSFRAVFSPSEPLSSGDYIVRVRVKGALGPSSQAGALAPSSQAGAAMASASETLRIALPEAPDATGELFVRRGPSTGNREAATSDLRFRRSDRLRLEIPTPSDAAVSARLLDRAGKPLNVPVTASVRDDADGSRWQVAQLALAPLAPSDYVIEVSSGGKRTLAGFRVIP